MYLIFFSVSCLKYRDIEKKFVILTFITGKINQNFQELSTQRETKDTGKKSEKPVSKKKSDLYRPLPEIVIMWKYKLYKIKRKFKIKQRVRGKNIDCAYLCSLHSATWNRKVRVLDHSRFHIETFLKYTYTAANSQTDRKVKFQTIQTNKCLKNKYHVKENHNSYIA